MKKLDPTLTGHLQGDTWGSRMRAARINARMTQAQAAQALGITPGHVGRIERGGVGMVADPKVLVRAARTYGVSDVWLYAGAAAGARFQPTWYVIHQEAA